MRITWIKKRTVSAVPLLLHEISRLDEVSCGHLLKYIRLMRDTEQ